MSTGITTSVDTEQVSDQELVAQALAADPIDELPDDAVSFDELTNADDFELLPDWYMPRPGPRARAIDGWRRTLVVVVVGSIVLLDAAGFCVIYGRITIG